MIRLASAYLFKRPVQVLAILGVAVGLCSLLLVNAVMNGLIESDRAAARGPLADLMLIPASGQSTAQWSDYQHALAPLMTDQGVDAPAILRAVAPHLITYAVLGLRGGERLLAHTLASDINGVQIVGIDPRAELEVAGYAQSLLDTRLQPVDDVSNPFATPGDDPFARPGILVPDALASALGIRVGETIEFGALPPQLPAIGEDFLPHNARFTVTGTFRPTDYEVGMDRIYAARSGENGVLWNLLGDGGPDFNEIMIELADEVDTATAKLRLLAALSAAGLPIPGGEEGGLLETWQERRATYLGAIDNEQRITALIMFFVVVVAAFGLFATLSALVREKVRDLGILAALGYTPLMRGWLLFSTGLAGSACGCLLGFGSAHWLAHQDRLFRILSKLGIDVFGSELYVINGLPTSWNSPQAINFSIAAFLCGCLFTLLPAIKAANLSPVEALGYE